MSDEKRTHEEKPIADKELDKVSGGHIQTPSPTGANTHRPGYGPPPLPGKGAQPD
jgi:hypothetical protein